MTVPRICTTCHVMSHITRHSRAQATCCQVRDRPLLPVSWLGAAHEGCDQYLVNYSQFRPKCCGKGERFRTFIISHFRPDPSRFADNPLCVRLPQQGRKYAITALTNNPKHCIYVPLLSGLVGTRTHVKAVDRFFNNVWQQVVCQLLTAKIIIFKRYFKWLSMSKNDSQLRTRTQSREDDNCAKTSWCNK